jgi:hypothetical protein
MGVAMLVVGFLCLNYTKGFDLDHHFEWAATHGLPRPTYSIFLAGAILEAVGAGAVGVGIGRRSGARTAA